MAKLVPLVTLNQPNLQIGFAIFASLFASMQTAILAGTPVSVMI